MYAQKFVAGSLQGRTFQGVALRRAASGEQCVDRAVQRGANGSYGNDFSPPRACALRNGWRTRWSSRASSFARSVFTAARTVRVRAAVKTELESEQTRELQAFLHLEQRRQRLPIGAPGGSTRTLARLFPRASPLGERCSCFVVDNTVPKAKIRKRLVQRPACRFARADKV